MTSPTLKTPLRPLGLTGFDVGVIGLGTVKLGRNTGLKHPTPFELPSDEQAIELLRTALRLGVNLIDTAPAYGVSEERLGTLLPRVAPRKQWIINTKVGEEFEPEKATSAFNFTPEHVRMSVERSLTRLKTDHVECVLVHSDGHDLDIIKRFGTLDALASLKREGKLRAFGMSTKTPEGGMAAVGACDVVMLTLNPRDRTDLKAIRAANERGVGVLVKKPLLSGHIGGAPELLPDQPELAELARTDPASACVKFVLREAGVSSVILGTTSAEHLETAVRASMTR